VELDLRSLRGGCRMLDAAGHDAWLDIFKRQVNRGVRAMVVENGDEPSRTRLGAPVWRGRRLVSS
jgi:hypothetical protein